mmetsp:Transcript_84902/g.245477  ORF Transcript_84902/g.245477 Transcript_84902/m.245477 type:complete len:318 (+) Transcript_84902:88-1041(+)
MLQALLLAAPAAAKSEFDRAALAAHASLLEHGFVPVAAGQDVITPTLSVGSDGAVSMRLLHSDWNATPESYSFSYMHPLRGPSETFSLKAVAVGGSLAVHAASSLPGAELLTVALKIDASAADVGDAAVVAMRAREWQEKVAAGVAIRLLARHNSTTRLGKALDAEAADAGPERLAAAGGTKRPAPVGDAGGSSDDAAMGRPTPLRGGDIGVERPTPGNPDLLPGGVPGFRPLLWTPDGGLLGPRHPAWGQGVPAGPRFGSSGGLGFLPRFDPIGPGTGEPEPDHLRVPGIHPDFPGFGFQGGATGGRMDPDGMFMM